MEMKSIAMEQLVEKIRAELFSPLTINLINSWSAYETAWVGMVPHPDHPNLPMSPRCLDWIISNQQDGGFWGELDGHNHPTLECITATLACLLALDTWSLGTQNVEQGFRFLHANMEEVLVEYRAAAGNQQLDWFAIVFPGMLELAQAKGLKILLDSYSDAVNYVFLDRERILKRMSSSSLGTNLLLAMYFDVLPESYKLKHGSTIKRRGPMFRSPAESACAFMATRDEVPSMYSIDDGLIKLCLVDHLERLGCGEHFNKEIGDVMHHAYRNWVIGEKQFSTKHDAWFQMYKDSLSFRLLRMHGYSVSPRRFCWFLYDDEMMLHIEENYSYYLGAMYSIYRASHVLFPQEEDLENAKAFSRKILQKGLPSCGDTIRDHDTAMLTNFQIEIKSELQLPWLARLDHLEHRKYIERNEGYVLWFGKPEFCRRRLVFPDYVRQLARQNFVMRQSAYRAELEGLKRWSKDASLSNMGFGREKTTYCYFSIATTSCLPLTSNVRKTVAKCATLVIVADDFFDEEGTMDELCTLTDAVKRWEGDGLSGHSKIIFDALDDLVMDITSKSFNLYGYHIKKILQEIWTETFESWLKESKWSKNRQAPSIKEYLKVSMISVAVHAMILPSCYLIGPELEDYSINSPYKTITKLLMVSTRLLNDMQSYKKEVEGGKLNMVLLYLKEKPKAQIGDSIAHIKNIVERNERELLALAIGDEYGDMPKEWKELHLSILKAFKKLYNSDNEFDSPTALLQDISLAIYEPLAMNVGSIREEASLHPCTLREEKSVHS